MDEKTRLANMKDVDYGVGLILANRIDENHKIYLEEKEAKDKIRIANVKKAEAEADKAEYEAQIAKLNLVQTLKRNTKC